MIIAYTINHYDCFGGHKCVRRTFDNVLECQEALRKDRSYTYDYDDSYTKVGTPYRVPSSYAKKVTNRPHARSREEWERIQSALCFSKDEIEYLCSLFN